MSESRGSDAREVPTNCATFGCLQGARQAICVFKRTLKGFVVYEREQRVSSIRHLPIAHATQIDDHARIVRPLR